MLVSRQSAELHQSESEHFESMHNFQISQMHRKEDRGPLAPQMKFILQIEPVFQFRG